ncbi:thermonuclease family protein [Pseudomonas spirodelae]|uniref:Thermonuclease family protein n=1 Tax=Pseudomonas spirodelae TaxID=3101751 RepID=A0ABU5P4N7_9PSED|nr:thermonuclease family protein [Pseudomonas sp. T5W1]MEA1604580.1 thermonuclease family protein [Pseudomonas sp. T5W1]
MRLKPWFFLSALLWASVLNAQELSCRVVALSDGDTFTCLDTFKNQHKIRLANIDTPEKDQPYGAKSKQILSGLIFAKQVVVDAQTKDRYGRTIALVTKDGLSVNREMVERGAAWVYPEYNQDPSLPGLERQAQAASRGIWGLPCWR